MTAKGNHSRMLLPLLVLTLGLPMIAGCHGDEAPVSPNAKTAAPARLPGEDPKSRTDQSLNNSGK